MILKMSRLNNFQYLNLYRLMLLITFLNLISQASKNQNTQSRDNATVSYCVTVVASELERLSRGGSILHAAPEPYLCWWSWGSSARVIAQLPHALHAPTFVPHTLHNSLSNSHVALSHQTVGIHAILVIQCDRIMRFTRQYSTVLSIHNKSRRCGLLRFSDLFTFP